MWVAPVVLAAVCLWLAAGCSSPKKTERWNDLEYDKSEVRTWAEQIEAQRALQADPASITGPNEPRPAVILSHTMTEEQRRSFQRRRMEALHKQGEKHKREAERRRRETLEIQQTLKPGKNNG